MRQKHRKRPDGIWDYTPLGGGDVEGGLGVGLGIRPEEAEYSRAVHCEATNYRPL